MAKYSNPVLLIIDEWLLLKPTETEQKNVFELLHRMRRKSSTFLCSQYQQEGWYDQLGEAASSLGDVILDCILHDSYKINIESVDTSKYISMLKYKGSINF